MKLILIIVATVIITLLVCGILFLRFVNKVMRY
jgi:hypothetical protein